MKNKKLMLIAVAAMGLVASATAGVSTMAWYQAQANAGIALGNGGSGSLTTEASTLEAINHSIDFTIDLADDDDKLELSHVVTAAEADAGLGGISAASLTTGDLVYGGLYKGAVKLKKAEATTNLITTYTVSAAWATDDAPTDSAEIDAIKNKYFTATLTATNQAKFVANAVSGLTNATTATVVFQITYSAGVWTFTAST